MSLLCWLFYEAEAKQFLRQVINIASTPLSAQAYGHHNNDDSFLFYPENDSVAPPHRPQASITCQIFHQRLPLFFGFVRQAVYAFLNSFAHSAIRDVLEHLSSLKGELDFVRQG